MTQTIQIRRAFWLSILALFTLFFAGACTAVEPTEPEQITMYVGSETADCVGVAPTTCLLVKFDQEAEWELFYDGIDGFEYEPGFEYELLVTKTEIENPPADASSIQYALVEVVSQTAVANSLAGTDWQWIRFDGLTEDDNIDVADPTRYTLTFLDDGTMAFQADCNSGNGSYALEDNVLIIDLGPITAAECEPDSLDSVFVAKLGEQNTFQRDEEGNLVLTVETGTIIFAPAPQAAASDNGQSTLLPADAGWRGIGRIQIASTCTAVLIDTGVGDEAPAYALTNGHCIEWITNGALTNLDVGGDIIFNYFADSQEAQIPVPMAEVAYSTMQGVDVAIVRLDTTLGALAEQEILPYPLADTPLGNGAVRVIGAPTDGVDPAAAFLREEMCQVQGQTDLLEFTWHFFDAYRTTCQDIFGGSSGSPVFSAAADTLHALMNTTVEGDSLCYLGAPCEIGESDVLLNQTSSYATPIHGLANCFDNRGAFVLSATCPLPPVEQLTFATQSPIGQPPLSWGATLTGTLPYYRYKTGDAASVDCRSVEDYSEPIPFSDAPTIDDTIPADEGFYLLCVLAGPAATVDDSWQSPDYPTVAIAQIDTTPPEEPLIDLFESAEVYRITPIFQPPELSDYLFKVGPLEETDCASEDGYLPYRRIPIEIERTGTPMRFCLIGFDHADNGTEPLVVDLDTQ